METQLSILDHRITETTLGKYAKQHTYEKRATLSS